MRVINPVDLFDCEMAGMMGSCKHLYNLLRIAEVYSIDDDVVGKCGGMLIILWLDPRVEVLSLYVDVAMLVEVVDNLIFNCMLFMISLSVYLAHGYWKHEIETGSVDHSLFQNYAVSLLLYQLLVVLVLLFVVEDVDRIAGCANLWDDWREWIVLGRVHVVYGCMGDD